MTSWDAPQPTPAPAAAVVAAPVERRNERYVAAVAGAVAVVAAVLPWATLQSAFGSVSRSGMADGGDGLFTAILGLAGGAAALMGGRMPVASIVAGFMIAGIGVLDIIDVSGLDDGNEFTSVSVGAGLYLTVIAGVVMVVAAVVCLQKPQN